MFSTPGENVLKTSGNNSPSTDNETQNDTVSRIILRLLPIGLCNRSKGMTII